MTDDAERWLPVVGYEGLYEVSDAGRVCTLPNAGTGRRPYARFLSICPPNGPTRHATVSLCRNGIRRTRSVHSLVLEAFIGPRPVGHQGCHFPDSDRANNRLGNLRWGTAKQNCQDRDTHGNTVRGERVHNARLSVVDVDEIRVMLDNPSLTHRAIGAAKGVNPTAIYKIAKGLNWRQEARPHGK